MLDGLEHRQRLDLGPAVVHRLPRFAFEPAGAIGLRGRDIQAGIDELFVGDEVSIAGPAEPFQRIERGW